MKKLTYEAPKVQVFGVETQNCFASGAQLSNMSVEEVEDWDS